MDPRTLDAASTRLACATLFPSFDGGVYAFEPDSPAAGTWLRGSVAAALPGEVAVRVPAMPGDHFALRRARCRILLEDALLALPRG
jgi:hypothetical protein